MRTVLPPLFAVSALLAASVWAFDDEIDRSVVSANNDPGFTTRKSTADGVSGMFEGQTDPLYVKLSSQPTGTVTVTFTSSNSDATIDTDPDTAGNQNTLSFTTSNWDEEQAVDITAAEDDDRTGSNNDKSESTTITMSASGADYEGIVGTETITIYDNDLILISPKILTVDEGSSGEFKVKLVQNPARTIILYQSFQGNLNSDLTYTPNVPGTSAAYLVFTSNNWNVEQTITVTAAEDDDTDDESHRTIIYYSIDADNYYYRAVSPLTVRVKDNEPLKVSKNSLSMGEGGSDTFDVRLGAQPSGTVTVNLTQSGTSNPDVSASPSQITFTTSNWDTDQTVTVSAVRDADFDDDSATIVLTATGGGISGSGTTVNVSVAVTDMKIITALSREDGSQSGIFEGESEPFYVRLSIQPSASTTVTLTSSNSDLTLDTDPETNGNQNFLTFTTSNWNENRTVMLTAAEDDDKNNTDSDKREAATITIAGEGADAGLSATVPMWIFDNDIILVTSDELTVNEGGSGSYSVKLARQPSSNVSVYHFVPTWFRDGNPLTYTSRRDFTPGNWNTPQTITVTAGEDDNTVAESYRTLLVSTVSSNGGDSYYDRAVKSITTKINDNDTPGLVTDPQSLEVDEGDDNTFKLRLATEPATNVTVNLSSSSSELTLSSTRISFTPAGWNTDQTVTVTAAEDDDAIDDDTSITFTASGADYGSVSDSLSVTIADDDTAGLTLNPSSLQIDEGAQKTFSVRLDTQPSANVRVSLAQPSNSEVTVDTDTGTAGNQTDLNFTTSNWDSPQNVTVSVADDDDYADDGSTTISLTASGGDYGDVTGSLDVSINETDSLGLDTQRSVSLTEGASATFTMKLTGAPTSGWVEVDLVQPSNADVTVDAQSGQSGNQTKVIFNSSNWNHSRTITVFAAEDDDGVADAATIAITLWDRVPNTRANDSITVSVSDNDPVGLSLSGLVSSNTLRVTEGESGEFTVKLKTEPTEQVTIALAQSGTNNPDVSFSPAQLVFTDENWNETQEVSVSTLVDADTTNEAATISLTPSGGEYDDSSASGSVSVVVLETNNPADLELSRTSLRITEGPGGIYSTGTVTIRLQSQPLANVTVAVTEEEVRHPVNWVGVKQDVNISPTSLTFTSSNWSTAQTVTLTSGEDDDLAEDDHADIVFTASGGDYAGVTSKMRLNVVEDDLFGHDINLPLTVDEGTTVTGGFWLTFQPEANGPVTASLVPLSSDLTVDHDPVTPGIQESLIFTSYNWLVPQNISIAFAEEDNARDDRLLLAFKMSTDVMITNPQYVDENGNPLGGKPYSTQTNSKRFLVRDNDEVGLIFSTLEPSIPEGDSSTITLKLEAQPTTLSGQPNADVTISFGSPSNNNVTVDTDSDRGGRQSTLTFTDGNWNIAQTVTLSAVDEEHLADYSLTIAVAVSGANYGHLSADLEVDVVNDDIPGLVTSPQTELVVGEGATNTFTVKLAVLTPANVTVAVTQPEGTDLTIVPQSLTFTPSNWTKEQTILVAAGSDDDAIDDRVAVSLSASGGGGYYDDVTHTLTVEVDDSDPRGLNFPRNVVIDEGGSYALPVRLETRPSGNVRLSMGVPTNSDVTRTPLSLDFTASNWNVPQTVRLSAAEDGDDTNESATMSLTASGSDYEGIVASTSIQVTDDDQIGLVVSPRNIVVNEGGNNTFSVRLAAQPTNQVTVSVGQPANPDITRSPISLSFTTSNWSTEQSVTVSAAEDEDQVNDSATIALNGGGTLVGRVSVTVTDNDVSGLSASPASLVIDEGATGSFSVQLTRRPSNDVLVTLTQPSDSDLSITPEDLVFTASIWDTQQNVSVTTAEDDDAIDEVVSVSLTASGATEYAGAIGSVSIEVTDTDTAALTFLDGTQTISAALNANEGSSGSFKVRLDTRPSAVVRVRLTQPSNPDVIADVDTAAEGIQTDLFFTPSNWNTPQTVPFSVAEDDDAIDDSASSIAFAASGGHYDGVTGSVSISVTDDDNAGLIFSSVSGTDDIPTLTVSEGGEGSFMLRLATQPGGNVSVGLSQPSGGDLTFTPPSLSFTPLNWKQLQTVNVAAAEDLDAVDDGTSVSLRGTGADYGNVAANLLITVEDNDTPGLVINPTDPALSEGGNNTFTVKLVTRPSSNVTVRLTQPSNSDLTLTPASLVFTDSNWNSTQTVTITAGEDEDVADDSVDITLTASGGGYDNVTGTASVSVFDNDVARISLSLTRLALNEGGVGTFEVNLTKLPGEDVTVRFRLQPADADLTIDTDATSPGNQSTLTFTVGSWDQVRTINVHADEDDDVTDDRATITLTAAGGGYDDVTGMVDISVEDDDSVGLTLSARDLELTEGGTVDFTVGLVAQPSADVTISISQPLNLDVRASPGSLTFTRDNWGTARRVRLSAAADDDAIDESTDFSLTASGGGYDGLSARLSVDVSDDDTPGLTINPLTLTVPEAGSETFTVRLTTRPSANVAVDLTSASNTDASLSPVRLTFTDKSWDKPQTATFSAAADNDAESETVLVSATASGGDYAGVTGNLTVRITDSDTPPDLVLSPTELTVTEGTSGKLKVKLLTIPSVDVKVSVLQPSDAGIIVDADTITPGNQDTLVFTNKNWNTFQLVTVFAATDDDDKNEKTSISLIAAGGDYTGVDGMVEVSVIDNTETVPGFVLSPRDLSLAEGTSHPLMVSLTTRPSTDVTVEFPRPSNTDVTVDTDTSASGKQNALLFTSLNWGVAQAVIVSAAQDSDADDEQADLSLVASGGDYRGITDRIAVSVTDKDSPPGFVLSPSERLTVSEGDSSTFTVRLATRPSEGVTLTMTQPSNSDVRVDTDTDREGYQNQISFTRSDWDRVQAVSVAAAADEDDIDDNASLSIYAAGAQEYSNLTETLAIVAIEADPSLSWPVKSVIPAIPPLSAQDTAALRIRCKEHSQDCDIFFDCTAQDGTIYRGRMNSPIAAMNTKTLSIEELADLVEGDWSGKGRLFCPLRSQQDISGQIWTRSGDAVLVNNSEILRSAEVVNARGRTYHQADIESIPSPGDFNLSNIRIRCEGRNDCTGVTFECYEDDGGLYSGILGFIGRKHTRHLQTQELSSMIGHHWHEMGLSCEVRSDNPFSVQILTRTGGGRALVNNSASGIVGN